MFYLIRSFAERNWLNQGNGVLKTGNVAPSIIICQRRLLLSCVCSCSPYLPLLRLEVTVAPPVSISNAVDVPFKRFKRRSAILLGVLKQTREKLCVDNQITGPSSCLTQADASLV